MSGVALWIVFGALSLAGTALTTLAYFHKSTDPSAQPMLWAARLLLSMGVAGLVAQWMTDLHIQGSIASIPVQAGGAAAVFLLVYNAQQPAK